MAATVAPRDFRSSVEQAFLRVMRRRFPDRRWRALSEQERAEFRDTPAEELRGPFAGAEGGEH
jgi:hypothetical protein